MPVMAICAAPLAASDPPAADADAPVSVAVASVPPPPTAVLCCHPVGVTRATSLASSSCSHPVGVTRLNVAMLRPS